MLHPFPPFQLRPWLFLPALISLGPPTLAGPEVDITAPISKVRIHPDGGWATRVGTCRVPGPGSWNLRLEGVPEGSDLDRLRVNLRGPEGTRMVGLRFATRSPVSDPARRMALDKQVKEFQQRKVRHELDQEVFRYLERHRERIQRFQIDRLKKGFGASQVSSAARMFEEEATDTQRQKDDLAAREESLNDAKQHLEAALNNHRVDGRRAPVLEVQVEALRGGSIELELAHPINLRWTPRYEARIAPARDKLDLTLIAVIQQQAGENLKGVAVDIVTGSSAQPPAMVEPSAIALTWKETATETRASAPVATQPRSEEEPISLALEDKVDLLVPGSERPGESEGPRFTVWSSTVSASLRYLALPRETSEVFLTTRFHPPQGCPIVAGAPIQVLAGSQHLGTETLELPAPGEPLKLGLGAVPGLRARLAQVERSFDANSKARIREKEPAKEWRLKERLDITSLLDTEVEVDVQDRVIQSATGSILVETTEDTRPGWSQPTPGSRSWVIKLPAGETASVQVGTRILAPKEGVLGGTGLQELRLEEK